MTEPSPPRRGLKRWQGLLLALSAVAIALIAVALLFQRQIGEAILARAIAATVGVDRSASLPDGLHVFVCGSGSPMPDPARAGPCLGVLAGERAFVVDAGAAGPRRLARMGFPFGKLERVYLTHLHSDHFDGLGELLLQAWVGAPRKQPLPVAGPPGVERVVAGLNEAYAIDAGFRTAHHGPSVADPAGFGGTPETLSALNDFAPSRVLLEEDGLRITLLLANHAPVEPAFGLRIDYKDRAVVISGDTTKMASLAVASEGADVLFHEALNSPLLRQMAAAAAARGQPHIAKIMTDIPDYHASPEEAAETAAAAGVGHLILYHIVPPIPGAYLNAAFLGDAPKLFSGKLTVAYDGLLVSLPAGQQAVTYRTLR